MYARRDKIMFVAIKLFSRHIFVATNTCLSREADCCRDKIQHTFVATKDVFCRQVFVATKIILVAAPDNDNIFGSVGFFSAERADLLMV